MISNRLGSRTPFIFSVGNSGGGRKGTKHGKAGTFVPKHSPTVADHPPPGHLLARQSYEHVSVTTRPRLGMPPLTHMSEVVYGRQLQAPNDHDAPTRLEELVGLVDLESTDGAERMVGDLAVRNRAEDDKVVDKDVVHGQDARACISGIGDSANGLGAEELYALRTVELNESSSNISVYPECVAGRLRRSACSRRGLF